MAELEAAMGRLRGSDRLVSEKSASKQYNTLITTVGSEPLEIIDALPYEEEAHREDLSKILELTRQLDDNESESIV